MKLLANDIFMFNGGNEETGEFHNFQGVFDEIGGLGGIYSYRYNYKNDIIKNLSCYMVDDLINIDLIKKHLNLDFTKKVIDKYGKKRRITNIDMSDGDTWIFHEGVDISVDLEINIIPIDYENLGIIIFLISREEYSRKKSSSYIQLLLMYIEEKMKNIFLKEKFDATQYALNGTYESINYGFIRVDSYGKIQKYNSAVEDLLNYDFNNLSSLYVDQIINIVHENPNNDYLDSIDNVFLSGVGSGWGNEGALISEDGNITYVDICYNPCFDVNGDVEAVAVFFSDITEKIYNEGRLSYISKYDIMTGLYNREHFIDLLENSVKKEDYFSIIVCDIDGLRKINRNWGYTYGDYVIKCFGKNLRNSVDNEDVFARWGDDEFAILVKSSDIDNANRICKDIQSQFDSNMNIKDQLTITFGISVKEKESDSGIDILTRAEKILRLNKKNDGGSLIL